MASETWRDHCTTCGKETIFRTAPNRDWFCTACGTHYDPVPEAWPAPPSLEPEAEGGILAHLKDRLVGEPAPVADDRTAFQRQYGMVRAAQPRQAPPASAFRYVVRVLAIGILAIIFVVGAFAAYNALQPSTSGTGALSTPTNPGVLTQDSYIQVSSHPDLYQGDMVQWTCTIAKFFGADSSGDQGLGCDVYHGTYTLGPTDGEAILLVPDSAGIDLNTMNTGDNLTVQGYVDQPYSGKTALGVDSSWPEITVSTITDHGVPPTPAY